MRTSTPTSTYVHATDTHRNTDTYTRKQIGSSTTSLNTHIYTDTFRDAPSCTHTHTDIHRYTRTHPHIHPDTQTYISTHQHTDPPTYTQTHKHTQTHLHVYIKYPDTQTHIHPPTHKHPPSHTPRYTSVFIPQTHNFLLKNSAMLDDSEKHLLGKQYYLSLINAQWEKGSLRD